MTQTLTDIATIDRRTADDRREEDAERRLEEAAVAEERREGPRRKKQRRRQIDPTTCERDYSDDEIQFMRALDDYKRNNGRMFPTCSEVLEVVRSIGYVKLTAEELAEWNADADVEMEDVVEEEDEFATVVSDV